VVFQKHALLPWLNVIDNVAFGLKLQGIPEARRYEIARGYIKLLGLGRFRTVPRLQPVGRDAAARRHRPRPDLRPQGSPDGRTLGALDALTREKAQELILNVWHTTHKSVFFITHSVEEALFMGTKLIVMSPRPGRIAHRFDLPFSRQFLAGTPARRSRPAATSSPCAKRCWKIIFSDEEALA
jgi:taurine transport system ATP-binding protein